MTPPDNKQSADEFTPEEWQRLKEYIRQLQSCTPPPRLANARELDDLNPPPLTREEVLKELDRRVEREQKRGR